MSIEVKTLVGYSAPVPNRPMCISPVRPQPWNKQSTKCRNQASITINGNPYCKKHGGCVLINMAMEGTL